MKTLDNQIAFVEYYFNVPSSHEYSPFSVPCSHSESLS